MSNPYGPKIPVIVITGFLGSGKTTLLNHLVRQPGMESTAIVINEFGEIGVDHLLVESSTEMMVEMNNGCICCTIRGDLADKLGSLAMWMDAGRVPRVDRVVVETTGLADPAPILHTLMTDQHLLDRFRLGGVLTMVDAIAGASALDRFPEAVKQAALADAIVVSKRDLVETLSEPQAYEEFIARIRAINRTGTFHEAVRGVIDPAILHGLGDRGVAATFAGLSDMIEAAGDHDECHDDSCDHAHVHQHRKSDEGITSFVVELHRAVDSRAFNEFLQELALEFGANLLRVKGILHVDDAPDMPAVIQGVQHVFFPVAWLDHWPDEERTSRLVFITHGVAPDVIRSRFGAQFV